MSYETITQCTRDTAFQDRVVAAAMKESYAGAPEFSGSDFAGQIQRLPQAAINTFIWPLSIDNEQDYAYAVESGKPNPGGDRSVITDLAIQAGIQKYWPGVLLSEPLNPETVVIPAPPEVTPAET